MMCMKIILRSVFETKLSSTSAPDVPIFERFAKSWPNLNKESFINAIKDTTVSVKISPVERGNCKSFCYDQLSKLQNREDYKELIQLALIFLGVDRYNFHTPGPIL